MATIAEVRQKYPEYSDLSDEQLGKLLHQKFYSDIPYEDFAAKAGIAQAPPSHTKAVPANQPTVQSLLKNVAGEALGGIADMDNMLRTPVPLGAGIQAATGVGRGEGLLSPPPLMGDEQFHDSATGRGVRWAGAAAAFPGQSVPMRAVNAGTSLLGGILDYGAEQEGMPWYKRIPLAVSPTLAAGGVAGLTKLALRGPPSKGVEMADNIATTEGMGVTDYSVSQVAPEGNTRLPLVERAISFAFGGQGPFQRLGKEQSAQLRTQAERIAGGSADDAEAAGKAVWNGLFASKTGWVSRAKASEKALWGNLDAKFQNVKAVKVKALETALDDLVASYDNPAIGQAVNADKVAAVKLRDAIKGANGQMSYNDFIKLRRELGELQSGSSLIPSERGISASQASRLWASVMDDYRAIAKSVGGDAEFAAAHSFSKNYHENSRNFFKTIFGKEAEPTRIIDEIASGNFQQPAKLRALRDALGPQEFGKLQEYVINRLGTPTGSKTGTFSLETFHTNYNNRFAGAGRSGEAVADAMFGKKGSPTRDALETMFKFSEKTKDGSQLLFNTSGTSGSGLAGASIQAILGDLAKKAAGMGVGAAAGAAATGGAGAGVAAGIMAGAGLTNAGARLFTSPRFARWLSKTAFQTNARFPSAIIALSQTPLESPELEEAKAAFLEEYKAFSARSSQ